MTISDTRDQALELFTIPEAAEVLRVPVGWLRKKVSAGLVPHSRLGKHVRFSAENLRQIVEIGSVQPTPTAVSPTGLSPRARRSGHSTAGRLQQDR